MQDSRTPPAWIRVRPLVDAVMLDAGRRGYPPVVCRRRGQAQGLVVITGVILWMTPYAIDLIAGSARPVWAAGTISCHADHRSRARVDRPVVHAGGEAAIVLGIAAVFLRV